MTSEREMLRPRLARRGEERLTRQSAVHLHEVDAEHGERVDGAPSVVGRMHLEVGDWRPVSFEIRTGGNDARSNQRPSRNVPTPSINEIEVAAHVADSGDPVRDV